MTARELARIAVREQGAAQDAEELAELAELVSELRPRCVVEIGVYLGGTAWLWRALAFGAYIVGVDRVHPRERCGGCLTRRAHNGCPAVRASASLDLFVLGDSQDAGTLSLVYDAADGRPVDFLHIDGDHDYAGVRGDFASYAPLVRSGGLVALHDVAGDGYPDVARFWREISAGNPRASSIVHRGDSLGFGLVRAP